LAGKGVPKQELGNERMVGNAHPFSSGHGQSGQAAVLHRLGSLCHQQGKLLTENRKLKTGF